MSDFDDNDIAIIGMAIRVPGASTPEEYWHNLSNGKESLRVYTDEELTARGVSAATLADPSYVKSGMPLQDMDQFDPEFFGFSPKEAAILDPQHRQFYEVAWEALERAGHPPKLFDGNIGVFAGCGMGAYFAFNLLSNPDLVESVGLFLLRHTGNDKDFLATRVSYAFDLKGPSVNVQTACSTSLVATHLAVQSLLARECDMALAGGVTIELPHRVGYHYREGEILSPDGHCRSFDHRSKGTIFGSGVGVVALRRVADAIAAGDHIHAIIKGSAVNNDGSGKVGYLAPSIDGQSAAVAEALAIADVDAETISYVECHGTATPVGDPIEITALTQAFRESTDKIGFCRVGSVKTNIGHLDTAAGVASLIKTALAIEHGQIPASLNFEAPNPTIAFDGSPFLVASTLMDWPKTSHPRRAAVNSLGVGGTNAFVVLQEAPKAPAVNRKASAQLMVLSARNRRSLDEAGVRLATWLRQHPEQPLADIAYTLFNGRHGFEQRRVFACSSHEEAVALLENGDARRIFNHSHELDRPSVVFMFPGGGAQYFQMARGLYDKESVFREHVDRGLALLKSRFSTNLSPVLLADSAAREDIVKQLAKPSVQLPLIFLVEYALTRLWEHYGVTPAAVIGHSLGENTAACVAGVFSFEDALGLVLLRGQLMDEVPEGAMLSVSLPAHELKPLLGAELDLAAANSPQLSVASGPAALIDQLAARLTEKGIDSQRVRINIAAHSRLLDGILGRFRSYLQSIRLNEPQLPIISNRTGKWLEPQRARDPEYWVEHLRNSVFFADGVDTLLESQDRVFLEVGPGNTLGSLVRQNSQAPMQRVFASLRHHEDPVADEVYLRAVMGRLWAVGVTINHDRLWNDNPQRIPLPTYAFQHSSYWIEPGVGSTVSSREDIRPQRLAELRDWFKAPRWVQQGILESDDTPCTWLVFQGREPVADALVQRLRAAEHRVITVLAGDTFARVGADAFTIAPEAGGVGYQELVDELVATDRLPDRVLHTWLLTWDRSFRPGSSFFHRNQEFGFYSLFHLAHALGKASVIDKKIHFIVAANGVQRIGDEALPFPDKATALGPCSVIPREFPNFTCQFVDVALETTSNTRGRNTAREQLASPVVSALESELFAKPATSVIAWRNNVRWQRHIDQWRSPAAPPVQRIRQQGVYLITGGLGGIAGVIAEWLAREYRARLVLLARTPLPHRKDWDEWLATHPADDSITRSIQRIRHLEALGAQVLAVDADVTVDERMQEVVAAVRKAFGEIHGVFHAAGVIRDNLIQLKSQREIEEVFSAKVYGTVVLDELFRKAPLDFMVLFSSTSSFIAPQGQVDYVGANSFLNAFAESCRGDRAYPVIAVNWGIWQGVGMVGSVSAKTDAPALSAQLSHATSLPVQHPWLEHRYSSRDGLAHAHGFTGTFSAEQDWAIDEHRLGNGDALLPGTGYLELIRASLAEIGNNDQWQLSNLVFLTPLFVRNDQPRDFRVQLRGDEQRWEVDIFARKLDAGTEDAWDQCASARVVRSESPPVPALSIATIEARCNGVVTTAGGSSALRTRQEDHLRFGPRWRVLRRLSLGSGEAIAHLHLSQEFAAEASEYRLHPALLDIATGCAMDLIPGYAAQETAQNLWAPISYRGCRYYAPLTAEVVSWLRVTADSSVDSGFAAFDVTIADTAGRVLVEIEQLTLRRIDVELRIPQPRHELPDAKEVASKPEKARSKPQSPGELALQHNVTQGIDARHGIQALSQLLNTATVPATLIVSSMELTALMRQAESISQTATANSDTRFTRPQLDSDFEAPRDETEKGLAELWGKLLGVEGVGIRDSFFDLGGHSLIAVRLFNEIADRYDVDLPMSVLMQSPTIAGLADIVRAKSGATGEIQSDATTQSSSAAKQVLQYQYLVPMHAGPVADRTPLFMVSGMFGNVLNLSHLAHLLGEDRSFYALQARGLYGDSVPHETFEEMARDYIEEIRKVQPTGPYLLGGFSGGGIAAYEIARQLLAQGEKITQVIFLDTPLPKIATFNIADRFAINWQEFRTSGLTLLADKVKGKIEWKRKQYLRRRENQKIEDGGSLQFQSRKIGDAFMRAVANYRMNSTPIRVALFRPRLDIRYRLSGGRLVDRERNFLMPDNGWSQYVSAIEVFEVPGNHDSMVLEPNVRVLVSLLRRAIKTAEESPTSGMPANTAAATNS